MKIAQQYEELQVLIKEIDSRLVDLDFLKIKELILWLMQSKTYQKLKGKENKLMMLDCFCIIWLEEKKCMTKLGVYEDIFGGIRSLADVERKYHIIEYSGLRIENKMPDYICEQAVDELIENKVSGIAISKIYIRETYKREENILQISRILKEKGQLATASILLQETLKTYPENEDMLMELAECQMLGGQWNKTLECLKKIKKPSAEVQELIEELEKVIKDENIQQ